MLFKDESEAKNFLVQPVDLQPISVPMKDIQVWEMVLPDSSDNYVCLGHPVTDSIENKPDPTKYCCASKDLIIEAKEQVFATSFTESRTHEVPGGPNSWWEVHGGAEYVEIEYCERQNMNKWGMCYPKSKKGLKFNEENIVKDDKNTWIAKENGGSIKVTFDKKVMIKHFILKTSEYPKRSHIGLVRKSYLIENFKKKLLISRF